MDYRVEISPKAKRQIKRFPPDISKRIIAKLEELAINPRPPQCRKLIATGRDRYRVRVGDYRIIYDVIDDILLVLVLVAGHRKDVYRNL